jgi:hypothetical protein
MHFVNYYFKNLHSAIKVVVIKKLESRKKCEIHNIITIEGLHVYMGTWYNIK